MWQDRISAAIWQMRSTFASSTCNQADPNRTINFQSWCQNTKGGLSRAWLSLFTRLWSRAFFITIFQVSQTHLADDGCFWHIQEHRHRSLASLVMTFDTGLQSTGRKQKVTYLSEEALSCSCTFPFFPQSLRSVQYWTEPQTSLVNVHKPATQVKVILGASCP